AHRGLDAGGGVRHDLRRADRLLQRPGGLPPRPRPGQPRDPDGHLLPRPPRRPLPDPRHRHPGPQLKTEAGRQPKGDTSPPRREGNKRSRQRPSAARRGRRPTSRARSDRSERRVLASERAPAPQVSCGAASEREEMSDDKPPRNLKAMLSEAKDTSELMVDLAYAALFFDDEKMAAEVHELEER